ncbi:MAG: type II secretion system protein GspC [Gammaproteobacteria bacterium]|nr:type II secretion system protein GspC [Gammaproteobacteria bacterium]
MGSEWLVSASDKLGSSWTVISAQLHSLADPQRARQVKLVVYCLAALWLISALVNLFWNLLPAPTAPTQTVTIVNPLDGTADSARRAAVKIDEMVSWNLFGTPDMKLPAAVADAVEHAASSSVGELAGIEDGARETRLSLRLQGVVASGVQSAARAIIEHQKVQQQYAVGDKLPVSGQVKVAKILTDRVVLDNGGKYELLLLFDKDSIATAPMASARVEQRRRNIDQRGNKNLTDLAESFRRRLYSNPQSLSDVVKISAVRVDGQLQGYRVSAGRARDQFESLGFKANDIVTGVNGIELDSPGKAMELYRVMRSAEQASFSVRRGEEQLTLVVGLKKPGEVPR